MALPGICAVRISGENCTEPEAYRVRLDDCAIRGCDGRLYCVGHPACIQHAAELRSGLYAFAQDGVFVTREGLVDVWEIAGAAR